MKLMVAFKLLVVFFCVHLAASAPLRLLRIRNMTFLFVESPDGDRVEILYAKGKGAGSFPTGQVPMEAAPADENPALAEDGSAPADHRSAPAHNDSALSEEDSASADDNSALAEDDSAPADDKTTLDDEEPFDPELDAPRVEPSVIQAPKFKSSCERGHRVDRNGNCRRIW